MPSFPVNQPVGTRVYGPFTIGNTPNTATAVFANWGAGSPVRVDLLIEVSYDAASTWETLVDVRRMNADGTGKYANPSVVVGPVPLVCSTCGNLYLAGDNRYNRALSHSTVTLNSGVTLAQIAAAVGYPVNSVADIQLRILVTPAGVDVDSQYVTRTFHTPTVAGAPLRRMRLTSTVTGGTLNTTLDVTLGA